MKNIFKLLLLCSAVLAVSCDDNLDINTDPNAPAEINKGLALTSAQAALVTVVGGDLMNLGGFFAQYHTQAPGATQYQNIDENNLTTEYANRIWPALYAGTLNDLQFVLQESAADGDTGTALMAEVLRSYTFQLLVDLFDDVPYTEALQGAANITPAVTPGEEIYPDLIARIDAALAAYQANPVASEVGNQDGIYQGDMDNWIRFANTLKLKLYIRMAYTPLANPAAVNALIAEDNFITEDADYDIFATSLNQRHPFYEVQIATTGLGDVNNIASNSLFNFYSENNDPRLEAVYRPNISGAYVSLPQGGGEGLQTQARNYSRPNIGMQTPVFLMTVAESNFLQAEGLIRYSGGAGAQERYNEGVRASFLTYQANFFLEDGDAVMTPGEATAAADELTGAGGAYEFEEGGGTEQMVRQVIIQKWASLAYVNNIEAWIETTRTKYPEIVPEENADYAEGNRIPSQISILPGSTVPSILFYPEQEVERNPNITQRSSTTQNVWWDQKPE